MKTNGSLTDRENVGEIECVSAEWPTANQRYFFVLTLELDQGKRLLRILEKGAKCVNRERFILASTHDNPKRLRVMKVPPPGYESRAAKQYLCADLYRVQGTKGVSCNITFSGAPGGELLARALKHALQQGRRYVTVRVQRKKKWQVVEFVSDVELETLTTAEGHALGDAGEALAALVWPAEDFSDWESSRA